MTILLINLAIADLMVMYHIENRIVQMFVKSSLKLEIDFNAMDNKGMTAFHFACESGHSEVARMLVENSAKLKINLNVKDDEDRKTAFHLVCEKGNSKTAQMLIQNPKKLHYLANTRENLANTYDVS